MPTFLERKRTVLGSGLATEKRSSPAHWPWGQALSPGNVLFLPFAPVTFIWIRPDPIRPDPIKK